MKVFYSHALLWPTKIQDRLYKIERLYNYRFVRDCCKPTYIKLVLTENNKTI